MNEKDINRYWNKIINTMNDGLMLVGDDGVILMVNRAFEQLTGYTADEVVGKSCTLLQCDACERVLKKEGGQWRCGLFEPGQKDIKRCRCLITKKDGTYLPALKNASVLRDDQGLPLGTVETLADLSELDRLDQEVDQLSRQINESGGFHGILGKSTVMQKTIEVIQKAAQSDAPVIIYGESGTGKELVARAIHRSGRRKEGPYVQLNCAALNEALLESELFGHVKGAFTGAYRHRRGRFEAANGGDIFLDEIGDVPLSIQVKLLRVLESKRFERVGDHQPIAADVRIITATNKNLEELIAQKRFREDFFFRINVFPIFLPPLRDRAEDIPLLVSTFINRLNATAGKDIAGLTSAAMQRFMDYRWPGNVRELKSALEFAFVVAENGLIDLDHLPPNITSAGGMLTQRDQSLRDSLARDHYRQTPSSPSLSPQNAEKNALIAALQQTKGNQTQAARILGVNRVTVWNRMKKYGVDVKKILST
ncbi:MAG: sigma 54-interacting transcriptional regulator [Desulfobacterales bacterium]|jgi:PAS domain S-box-containing protein|nr:sigma 54-interacting transcriptional regulator [Deltaproteobacteria bacterium]